ARARRTWVHRRTVCGLKVPSMQSASASGAATAFDGYCIEGLPWDPSPTDLPLARAGIAVMVRAMTDPRLRETEGPKPAAVVLGVQFPGVDDAAFDASLKELERLAQTLGVEVIGRVT